MDELLKALLDNDFYKTVWKDEKVIIKTISCLEIEETLDSFIERFINCKTFPYVNSLYNQLLVNGFDELPKANKVEIGGIIEKYLNDIDTKHWKVFELLSEKQLIDDYGFSENEIKSTTKENLFESVKGGYYCEMLLSCILLSLGFEKVVSKLYFQFGSFSPTGIDVPFVNIESRTIILGECKIYKNILNAINSCASDLEKIVKDDKLNKEFMEWKAKYTSLNENFQEFLSDNSIATFENFVTNISNIVVLGFVLGNKIDISKLKEIIEKIDRFEAKEKFTILLITIPIDSKDIFVEKCYKTLLKIKTDL